MKKWFRRLLVSLIIGDFSLLGNAFAAGSRDVPRTIIALYDPQQYSEWQARGTAATLVHTLASMPLNHLGLVVEFHNIQEPLPDFSKRSDVRGIITWFESGVRLSDPQAYLKWAGRMIDSGKRFVILGDPGFMEDNHSNPTSMVVMNAFFKKLGMHLEDNWVDITYDVSITQLDPSVVDFERKNNSFLPAYQQIRAISPDVTSYFSVRKGTSSDLDADLVMTGPHGGYAAGGYEFFDYYKNRESHARQWMINPFIFFARAFGTDDLPKPDVTTLAGRRTYYSQIDGDGWNNVTQIEDYKGKDILSSRVIMDKVIKAYPELPVTVSPIAADLDAEWTGTEKSIQVAKEIFLLPQVEAGTHTYSHPFAWHFFEDGNPDKEIPYLKQYMGKVWEQPKGNLTLTSLWQKKEKGTATAGMLNSDYKTPRAYAAKPFDLDLEIEGSVERISPLLPLGKKVEVMQWPGDCMPFEKALAMVYDAGLKNVNGGDTRFDEEYPSYSWVSPIGRKVGNYQQIYASSSNENTYTSLWSRRFYGYKYVLSTIKNTESPIRLKPFNLYYHMYSGEKEASLKALLTDLDYARTQELTPVTTSHYVNMANGFYTTRITALGTNRWRISDREGLATIRFDNAEGRAVDFNTSSGVIGQRHYQGSLYVYLDENNPEAIIALRQMALKHGTEAAANVPYLVQSRWQIMKLKQQGRSFSFISQGFGRGDMEWSVPFNGVYEIKVDGGKHYTQRVTGKHLKFTLDDNAVTPRRIQVTYRGNA